MRRNKILLVALVGIILTVMTIGSASATTWTYGNYNLKTTYTGVSPYVNLDPNQPSGNYNVADGDYVQWGNIFRNDVGRTVTAIAAGNSGGLNYNELSWSVGASSTSPVRTFWTTVSDGDASYTIYAWHAYNDGGYYTSPVCTSMTFN